MAETFDLDLNDITYCLIVGYIFVEVTDDVEVSYS